jgi:hypothetical protein
VHPLKGTISFTRKTGFVVDGERQVFLAPRTFGLNPATGELKLDGEPVTLVVGVWTAKFALENAAGTRVAIPDITFTVEPDQTVNLSTLVPITTVNGVMLAQGPPGPPGPPGNGASNVMVYEGNLNAPRPSTSSAVVWFWPSEPPNADDTKDVLIVVTPTVS